MILLEEFDPDSPEIIRPGKFRNPDFRIPETAVSCFTYDIFKELLRTGEFETTPSFYTRGTGHPVYTGVYKGKFLACYLAPVGAPACTAVLEEIYAAGIGKVIIFGTCGVLDRSISDGTVIIPDCALRDEGTSYHYAPPSDEIRIDDRYREEFQQLLEERNIPWITGKVWTTDAIYRETRKKAEKRRQQGCICVDMECAALTAAAQFRGKELFPFFYAADNLDAETWDPRSLSPEKKKSRKKLLAETAVELATLITE